MHPRALLCCRHVRHRTAPGSPSPRLPTAGPSCAPVRPPPRRSPVLPPSRLVDVRPAHALAGVREDPFALGVASGDPLPTAVVLWTRLVKDPFDADLDGRDRTSR